MKMKQKFPIGSSIISATAGIIVCVAAGPTIPISTSIVVVMGGAGWLFGKKVAYEKGERANEYFNEGENFYEQKEYSRALELYVRAIKQNPEHVEALYKLGRLFQYGQGVESDLDRAKKYYEKAIQEGHYKSKKQLLILENPTLETAAEWSNLGEDYYYGRNGKRLDYTSARACYKKAVSLHLEPSYLSSLFYSHDQENSTYAHTLYSLGFLYHRGGYGITKDLQVAKEWYQKAIEKGSEDAKKELISVKRELVSLQGVKFTNSQKWYELGEDYYQEKPNPDYLSALICYEESLKFGLHKDSIFSLGRLYHKGQGVEKNLPAAMIFYQSAVDLGHEDAKKQLEKAQQEYVNSNAFYLYQSAKTFWDWASYLWAPAYVDKLVKLLLPPVTDWVAEQTGFSSISTVGRGVTQGVAALSHPIGPVAYAVEYAVENTVGYILHESVKKLPIDSPGAKALLLLSADYLSSNAKGITRDVIAYNPSSGNRPGSFYIKDKDGNEQLYLGPEDSETMDRLSRERSWTFIPRNEVDGQPIQNPLNTPQASQSASSSPTDNESSPQHEVYLIKEPLGNQWFSWFRHLDPRATHAGFIIKDLKTGKLTLIEISKEKFKENRINIVEIDKFGGGSKQWYPVGTTRLGKSEIIQKAENWAGTNPDYKFNDKNCRSFTDSMLRGIILKDGKLSENLRPSAFRESPTEAGERRLRKDEKHHKKRRPKILRSSP